MKDEVDVLDSPSRIVPMVSVDRQLELALLTELRSCVKVEVDVLGSPSLVVPTVSVNIEHH